MKLILKTGIVLGFFLITSITIRTADWAQHVAAPYLSALQENVRCNRWEAANNLNTFAKEHHHAQATVECVFDKRGCERAGALWKEYDASHANYVRRWRFLKALGL
jgi:hypothetical protein